MNVSKNRDICEGIIQMAHNLGLEVIAEGVEKKEQLDILKEMLCDSVQGFLYSPPLPEDELEVVLTENMERMAKNKTTKKHEFKYTALYSRMSRLREKEKKLINCLIKSFVKGWFQRTWYYIQKLYER